MSLMLVNVMDIVSSGTGDGIISAGSNDGCGQLWQRMDVVSGGGSNC